MTTSVDRRSPRLRAVPADDGPIGSFVLPRAAGHGENVALENAALEV